MNKVIKTLKTNVSLFNRWRAIHRPKIDLSWADLSCANLSGADLSCANISWADLSGADLRGANLRGANLNGVNLSWADLSRGDLSRANLRGANLRGARLSGADLDFAAWSLSCCSLRPKTDEKIRVQLMFHALSLIKHADNATEEELAMLRYCKNYANKFHREDVERL